MISGSAQSGKSLPGKAVLTRMMALDDTSFQQQIKEQKPVLVDFWAPWCGPCRRMAPILEELADEYEDRLTVAKVNVDEHPQVASAQSVRSIPTLVLYRAGEEVQRVIGLRPKGELKKLLDGVTSG